MYAVHHNNHTSQENDVAFEEKSVVSVYAPAEEQFDDMGYPTQAKPVKQQYHNRIFI